MSTLGTHGTSTSVNSKGGVKVFAIAAAAMLALAACIVGVGNAWANTAANPYTTWGEIVNAVNNGETEVYYKGEIYANSTIEVNHDVKLSSTDGGAIHRSKNIGWNYNDSNFANPLFKVTGGTLTLENATLSGVDEDGNSTWLQSNANPTAAGGRRDSGFFITVEGGTLDISKDSSLQDVTWNVSGNEGITETAAGIPAPYGLNMAPVVVKSGAANMTGGKITNCSIVDRTKAANNKSGENQSGEDVNPELTGRKMDAALYAIGVNTETYSNYEYRNYNYTSGGILYLNDSKGEISNGSEISNNASDAGAILATGTSVVTFKDSAIKDNTGVAASGGVALHEKASFTMESGEISNNTAWHLGGGVTATANNNSTDEKPNGDNADGATFTMIGGKIDGNESYDKGGGIRVESNNVVLKSGDISNNKARIMGGGVYVQGDNDLFAVMTLDKGHIYNNLATMAGSEDGKLWNEDQADAWQGRVGAAKDNTVFGNNDPDGLSNDKKLPNGDAADAQDYNFHSGSGGGIWSCPFGTFSLDSEAVVVNNNVAEYQGDDIHKNNGAMQSSDGGTILGLTGDWNYDNNEKYGQDSDLTGEYDLADAAFLMEGVNLINNDTDANKAGIQIYGNTSRRGGGIGSNGTLLFGEVEDLNEKAFVDVTKDWAEGTKPAGETKVTLDPYIEIEYTDTDGTTKTVKKDLGNVTLGDHLVLTKDDAAKDNTSVVSVNNWDARLAIPTVVEVTMADGTTQELRVYEPVATTDNWPSTPSTWKVFFNEVKVEVDGKDVTSNYVLDQSEPIELKKESEEGKKDGSYTITKTYKDGEGEEQTISFGKYFFGQKLKNIKGAEIEKYVNQDVHSDIVEFDKAFTYDILAYVPADATENLHIEDTLVGTLEFAGENAVSAVVLKDTNDHNVGGTVTTNGTDIKSSFTIKRDGQTLTLDAATVPAEWQGKWVQVTFSAQIADAASQTLATLSADTNNWNTITDNGNVLGGGASHTGIQNKANYTVDGDNKHKYNAESNTVTVKPEETSVKVTKKWTNSTDGNLAWPQGEDGQDVKVTIKLMKKTGDAEPVAVDGKTATLDQANNTYTFTNLPKLENTTYTVVESSVTGVDAEEFTTSVSGNEETGYTVTNKEKKPEPTTIELGTAIKNLDGNRSAQIFTFELTGTGIDGKVTVNNDAQGNIALPTQTITEAGTYTYTLQEVAENNPRYTYDTTILTATFEVVEQDGRLVYTGDEENSFNRKTFKNTTNPMDVEISKVDAVDTTAELPGAQLTIKDANNNVVKDAEGNDLTWISGNEPHTVKLYDGTYKLEEIQAPGHYDVAETITFTVKDGKVAGDKVVMEDARKTVDVKVTKNDSENADKKLEGAEFTIEGTDFKGATVNATKLTYDAATQTYTTAEAIEGGLYDGTYTLKETKAPNGYILPEGTGVEITINNGVVEGGNVVSGIVVVPNEHKTVKISKTDAATTEELPGATLIVKNDKGEQVAKWVSTNTPHEVALEDGKYTLTEITAPDGYAVAETITFEVKNGEVEGGKVEMKDAPNKVTISKVEMGGGKELPGATLIVKNDKGETIEKFVSGNEPHTIDKLPKGTYTLTEITAPDGYAVAETITFRVNEDGSVDAQDKNGNWVDANQHVVMEDAPTKVTISKQEVGGGKEIDGAKLTVKNDKGNEVASWTSGGEPHVIEKLPVGEYTLTEVTAPAGYEVAETMTFRINEDGTVECKDANGNWVDATEHVVMFDAPKSVSISKQDITNGNELPGATLVIRDINGNVVDQWVSGTTPHQVVLEDGTYTLTEITAPKGYDVAETITFEVKDHQVAGGQVVMQDKPTEDEGEEGGEKPNPNNPGGNNEDDQPNGEDGTGTGSTSANGTGNTGATTVTRSGNNATTTTGTTGASGASSATRTATTADDSMSLILGVGAIAIAAGALGTIALRRRQQD